MEEKISFTKKSKIKLPEGAEEIKRDVRTNIEEIENGFLIIKNFDIKYTIGDKTDYLYYTKKVFSETNPVQIKEDKMLADYFK